MSAKPESAASDTTSVELCPVYNGAMLLHISHLYYTGMSSTPANTGQLQDGVRDDAGRFLPGKSGNPAGKPVGARNFTTKVREALAKIAEEDGDDSITWETLLVQRILKLAIVEGNTKMIELLWNYIDGKPTQHNVNEHYVGDKTLEDLLDEYENDDNAETTTNQPPADREVGADTKQEGGNSTLPAKRGTGVLLGKKNPKKHIVKGKAKRPNKNNRRGPVNGLHKKNDKRSGNKSRKG